MKKKVYVETTVLSYLVARKSTSRIMAGHQDATTAFWRRRTAFAVYVSDLVVQEAARGDPARAKDRLEAPGELPVLEADEEARDLASVLIARHTMPPEYPDDAMHIAIATVNGMDFLLTWNFAHINNATTRMQIRQVAQEAGYFAPEICSPEELLGDEA